ncbi:MAG: prolipoprotein diacylglyceryl transferase [Patescibacteria group bacterium]
MINFLHTFSPSAILLTIGPLTVYWYGLFMVLSILAALGITFYLAKFHKIKRDLIFDLAFWLIIGGLIGARIYDVFLQLPYYLNHPFQVFAVWKGGLAIHGAILAGLLVVWLFAKKHHLAFWQLIALIAPGLALGQAIGRWGNYFNQELFGLPTALPWGIPIEVINRPLEYLNVNFFHPTFLYESIGSFLIFIILTALTLVFFTKIKKSAAETSRLSLEDSRDAAEKINAETAASKTPTANRRFYVWISALYMILYSILRLSLEFIRLDETPLLFGWRWPQIISFGLIIFFILILIFYPYDNQLAKIKNELENETKK